MDFNFGDLKKETNSAVENIFDRADDAKKHAQDMLGDFDDVLGGGGIEKSDNVKSDGLADPLDPQAFVQRMSAGAKEAQEELDAKFSKNTNDLDDFLGQTTNSVKQGVASLTNDFMNAERGFKDTAGDAAKEIEKKAAQAVDDIFGHFGGGDNNLNKPTAPTESVATNANNQFSEFDDADDDEDEPAAMTTFGKTAATGIAASNKDSDNDSPSISYNPSPAKKLPSDALKEQDNEKFISSEDLLGDFKDERTATPDSQASATNYSAPLAKLQEPKTTDLDADDFDDDFVQAEIPKHNTEEATNIPSAPVVESTPVSVATPKPVPVPVEPVKEQPTPVPEIKKEVPAPAAPAVATPSTTAPTPVVTKQSSPVAPKPTTATVSKTTQEQPSIVSVEDIFYKYGLDAWFKPERLHPRVESLIYWRDVKKSGIVFGAGLVTLLAISCFSVISVFAYLSLLLLAGTIAFRIYKSVMQAIQKTSDGHPFKEYLEFDLTLSQEKIQNVAGVAVAHINGFTAELRRLFLVEDLVDSIKFGVILWVMTYIGAWFNGMTLVILAFVSLFTLPKVYENNKQSIDTYLDLARSKVAEVTEKIKAAIPIGNKKPVAAETDKDK
ncbi:reticulon isoform X2 [Musca autumnalis]|uniref:reticulon isoform X2 n=1 Tax=Musca autumnalis TaxID=221902 RepID=UPI003CF341B3